MDKSLLLAVQELIDLFDNEGRCFTFAVEKKLDALRPYLPFEKYLAETAWLEREGSND